MKRLAITISGAVSLGAYEAGVMYELLRALESHNANHPTDQILIDVLTGASAGGMTAAILAQKLLFQPDRLREVSNNDLYLPWVKDIDLSNLLKLKADESEFLSIFSSDLVEDISKKYVVLPTTLGPNVKSPQPHSAVAPQLKLGLAMSNLNGIDYGLKLTSGGAMPYTRFQDEVKIDIDSTNLDHIKAEFWEPIRNAAVACGAFPFAFRVKDVLRHVSEYQDPVPLQFPATGMHFAYTDGGTFQNEPIGLAKQLVDSIDRHQNEQRYYIFVAPGMRESASSTFSAASGSSYFDYWHTGLSLANAIFNQARYRDLENVERINKRIAVFNEQAVRLKDLFLAGTINASVLRPATTPLLNGLFQSNAETLPATSREDALIRLRAQFLGEYQEIVRSKSQENADAWIDAILLLESVASLGPKDEMKIFAITENADKLAGGSFYSFGGFFDIAYRQHDYDRGRKNVRDFIVWLNGTTDTGLGPIDYPESTHAISIDSSLDGVKMESLSRSKRQSLRNRLYDRIHAFLAEIGIPALVRGAIDIGYLDKFLDNLFAL